MTDKKVIGFYGTVGLIYISLWVGIGIASVGQARECSPGEYGWNLPLMILVITLLPLVLGYFEGAEHE